MLSLPLLLHRRGVSSRLLKGWSASNFKKGTPGLQAISVRFFAKRRKKVSSALNSMRPPPPKVSSSKQFEEDRLVYEYVHNGRFIRIVYNFMGFSSVFYFATISKMLLQPGWGGGLEATTGALGLFSVICVICMRTLQKRHLTKIELEKGGKSVRLSYGSLFTIHNSTSYPIKDIKQPEITRQRAKGHSKYCLVGTDFGYYVYDERGVIDPVLLQYVFATS
ncbi:hypothetical protein AAMO2058_001649200 [Amorphochlora amoebiformis]